MRVLLQDLLSVKETKNKSKHLPTDFYVSEGVLFNKYINKDLNKVFGCDKINQIK